MATKITDRAVDALNRRRWAIDQKKRADAAFAATVKPVDQERAERLTGLRTMEALMVQLPHQPEVLERIRAEIRYLEMTS